MLLAKELSDFNSDMYLDLIMEFNSDIEIEETNKFTEEEDLRALSVDLLLNRLEKSLSVSVDQVEKMLNRNLEASDLIRLCHLGIKIANAKIESNTRRRSAGSDESSPNKRKSKNRNPIQNATTLDLKRRLGEQEDASHTGPQDDLDDNMKRWLVIGICLNSILSPALRIFVEPVLIKFYNSLKLSHQIHTQTYPNQLKTYGAAKISLSYGTINNNKTTHGNNKANYDFKVQNEVDLSKLFCQTHMAHYTAFDGSCDPTALFGLINKIDNFPSDVKTTADDVRSTVRNEWAHCNFTVWDDVKYVQSLQLIEDLIYLLKIDAADEKEMIEELEKWRKNGPSFLQGYTISFELAKEINQRIQALVEYTDVISKTADKEFVTAHEKLINFMETLSLWEKRFSTIENTLAVHEKAIEEHGSLYDSDSPKIERWKLNCKDFIKTDIFTDILGILKDNHGVLLTGVSGMGKTMTAQNIALQLCHEEGYSIVPCKNVKDIENRYKSNVRQVFFVDDICGKYTANIKDIENWIRIKEFVNSILRKGQTKILATCRTEIVKEENLEKTLKSFLKLFDLTRNYSTGDKMKLARKYLKVDDQKLKDIVKKVEFSPLMCFLYSKHDSFDVNEFLNSPYKTFSGEWDKLKTFDKKKYCVLLLCVIHCGTINEAIFDVPNDDDTARQMKFKYIFDCCRLCCETPFSTIKDKLNAGDGTYFIKEDREFKVIHDKMFDFLCCYFGKTLIDPIIKFADDKLISERVQLESIQKQHGEFTIIIPSAEEHKYMKRLRTDLKNGKIHWCLNNVQMRYKEYRYMFLDSMKDFGDDTKRRVIDMKDENGNTAFIVICLRGYEELVNAFISFGADVNAQNGWFTPLTAACRDGHLDTVDILLKNGSTVNQINDKWETPLYTACICGHYSLVERLLEASADINKPNRHNRTPLYASCLGGYESIVKLLIAKGAKVSNCSDLVIGATIAGNDKIVDTLITKRCDLNSVDLQGKTALFIACEEGLTKIVQLLLDNHADTCKEDSEGRTPLQAAKIAGNNNIVSMLTQNKSHVFIPKIEQTLDNKRNMPPVGWTPLYEACTRGDIKTVRSHIENNANVNMANTNGETPLVAACQLSNGPLIDMLLNEGAEINPALFIAIQNNYDTAIKILVDKGGELDYNNDNGLDWKSVMTEACTKGSIFGVKYLIEKGLDVNQVNNNEHAPICIACTNGYDEIVQLLIKKGAILNDHCIKDGKTPLYFACKLGFDKIAEVLIVNGANFNQKEEHERTLLHIACNIKVFKLLSDKGLEYNIKDKNGRYPLFESMNKGFDDISEFLVQKKSPIADSADDKKTALISVFDRGNTSLSTLLVSKGYTNELPNFNKTMLYYAYRLGLIEQVKNLLQDGVDFKKLYEYGYSPMKIADIAGNENLSHFLQSKERKHTRTQHTSDFHTEDEVVFVANIEKYEGEFYITQDEYLCLFRACMTGKIEATMYTSMKTNMFFKSMEPTGSIWFEQTPLCLASRRGHTEVVRLLLKYGANVNLTFEEHTVEKVYGSSNIIRYGYTPLFAAYQRKYNKIVDILLQEGANLNKALYDACREGYFETAKFLLDKGADSDVNSICRFGQTALHAACIGGSYTLVELLIARGAIINTRTEIGTSRFVIYDKIFKLWKERNETTGNIAQALLHKACENGNYRNVEKLIDHGVYVDVSNSDGVTPLMLCLLEIKKVHTDNLFKTIKLLIKKDAIINRRDKNGRTALDLATCIGNARLIKLLSDYEAKR